MARDADDFVFAALLVAVAAEPGLWKGRNVELGLSHRHQHAAHRDRDDAGKPRPAEALAKVHAACERAEQHRRGLTSVPGLYFVGLPWLTCAESSFLFGVGDDAAWIASCIVGVGHKVFAPSSDSR